MAKKVKVIGDIPAMIAGFALKQTEKLVEKVNNEWLSAVLVNVNATLSDVVDALSDNDPNNKEQVEAAVKEMVPELVEDMLVVVDSKVSEALSDENPKYIEAQKYFSSIVAASARIAFDDNPDNKAQYKALLDQAIEKINFEEVD